MRKTLVLLLILFFSVCSLSFAKNFNNSTLVPKNKTKKTLKNKESLIYYPVPYIPVLKDMKYDSDNSAILKSGNTIIGMLVFRGSYTAKDLIDFYKVQMKNNGWKEIGSFSSKITFIAYKRPGGSAFISVSEGYFSTELRIVVILTQND